MVEFEDMYPATSSFGTVSRVTGNIPPAIILPLLLCSIHLLLPINMFSQVEGDASTDSRVNGAKVGSVGTTRNARCKFARW